jgi:hypothetical protein
MFYFRTAARKAWRGSVFKTSFFSSHPRRAIFTP